MVRGGLWTPRLRLAWRIRKTIRKLESEGFMSEMSDRLVNLFDGVVEGKTPLDTGNCAQDIAYTYAFDKFADNAEARRIGEVEKKEAIKDVRDRLKKL